jgi:hypothetical protein
MNIHIAVPTVLAVGCIIIQSCSSGLVLTLLALPLGSEATVLASTPRRRFHEHLFVKIGIEVSPYDIDLVDLPILLGCVCEDDPDR